MKSLHVVLTGGGTGGSVTSLLAIAEELQAQDPKIRFTFIGTDDGPERELVEQSGIEFTSIHAGKLRRYFSFHNFFDLFKIAGGTMQSLARLRDLKPDIIVGTGSFVSVPVMWAGRMLRIPSLAHQLDIDLGLANKLVLPSVSRLTLGFEETRQQLETSKALVTGNPYRKEILKGSVEEARSLFNLRSNLPTIVVMGGGTGALRLNQLIASASLRLLEHFQILHLTGKGKGGFSVPHPNYHTYEFLTVEMPHAYAVADIVISRAGLSTLTELSLLGKPSIIVPIPGSHQVRNAEYFKLHDAIKVLPEQSLQASRLLTEVEQLMSNADVRNELAMHMQQLARPDATKKIAQEILRITGKVE